MPEGHTVHRLADAFTAIFGGHRVAVSSPQGRFRAGAQVIDGRVVAPAEAVGKQMFVPFDVVVPGAGSGDVREPTGDERRWLRVHLGLYGAWTFASDGSHDVVHAIGAPRKRVSETETVLPSAGAAPSGVRAPAFPPEPRGQVRVRVLSAHAAADLTGPTACEVLTTAEKEAVVARLGPDPLRADADPERFVAAVGRARTPVATLLMDQGVLAGVGNIYRAEALFRARLDPMAPGRALPAEVVRSLWSDLVALMQDGVRTGRIVTTRPEDRGDGSPDAGRSRRRGAARQNSDDDPGVVPREESFYVYQRDGLPCRVCGTTVALRELGGRKLYWCPCCQR